MPDDDEDFDDLPDAEREELEDELVDDVTAAETVAELEAEIATLQALERARRRACAASGTDTQVDEASARCSTTRRRCATPPAPGAS